MQSPFISCFSTDLRRPRSEPSSYYSNECQRDLPLAKKHKPNPEIVQAQMDKPATGPLSADQQTHKLSASSNPSSPDKSPSGEGLAAGGVPQAKMGTFRGGHFPRAARETLRKGGGIGKEKLANRLRQRGESLGMLGMVDTEMLSYKEDLENQDCLSHMEDLQVRSAHACI